MVRDERNAPRKGYRVSSQFSKVENFGQHIIFKDLIMIFKVKIRWTEGKLIDK